MVINAGDDWNRSIECNAAVHRNANPVFGTAGKADRRFGIVCAGMSSFVKYADNPEGIPPSIAAISSISRARDAGNRQAPANGGPP